MLPSARRVRFNHSVVTGLAAHYRPGGVSPASIMRSSACLRKLWATIENASCALRSPLSFEIAGAVSTSVVLARALSAAKMRLSPVRVKRKDAL